MGQKQKLHNRKWPFQFTFNLKLFKHNGLFMHIECVFIEIHLLKNKYLAKIIAYKKIKAFFPMQKTYNIGSTKFSFPFNIELLFHYVVLKCLLQGSQMQLFCIISNFFRLELNSGHAIFLHFVTLHHSKANVWKHEILTKFYFICFLQNIFVMVSIA